MTIGVRVWGDEVDFSYATAELVTIEKKTARDRTDRTSKDRTDSFLENVGEIVVSARGAPSPPTRAGSPYQRKGTRLPVRNAC